MATAIATQAKTTNQKTTAGVDPTLEKWVKLLDEAIEIPGTKYRIGLDGIVGLIPVVGDALTALSMVWMLKEAQRLGVSRWGQFQITMNFLTDLGIGAIPLVGDLFDFGFKANARSLRHIRRHLEKQQQQI